MAERKAIRCAIYTRKSSEEGLEQDFNSLDAQREACAAFIASQKHEGWIAVHGLYDDGGYSGGTLGRPALQRLMADIRARRVDVIVVYKVDRLTRSLADFAKIVELLDAQKASFVSVTQQFNTTTSMGRLTLNVLLSFAQFEREVTGERIRDKFKASRQKGMWMGGNPPLGYDVADRALVINPAEAEAVRQIFELYADYGTVRTLQAELAQRGIRSKRRTSASGRMWGGVAFTRGALYQILSNPIYIGKAVHKGVHHEGLHDPIISEDLWQRVQAKLATHRVERRSDGPIRSASLLAGRLFDEAGERLTPSHAKKDGKRYRYYVSRHLVAGGASAGGDWRLPAETLEMAALAGLKRLLSDHAKIVDLLQLTGPSASGLPAILKRIDALIEGVEQRPVCERSRALIAKVVVSDASLEVHADLAALRRSVELDAAEESQGQRVHVVTMAMRMARRGVEQKLVLGNGSEVMPTKPDDVLSKALARAHVWFDDLVQGRAATVDAIAKREGLGRQYVSEMLQLAFLAPDIVEAILAGHQPPELTLKALMVRVDLAADWAVQRRQLGVRT